MDPGTPRDPIGSLGILAAWSPIRPLRRSLEGGEFLEKISGEPAPLKCLVKARHVYSTPSNNLEEPPPRALNGLKGLIRPLRGP